MDQSHIERELRQFLLITKNRSSVTLFLQFELPAKALPGTIWSLRESRDDQAFWTSVVATLSLYGSGMDVVL